MQTQNHGEKTCIGIATSVWGTYSYDPLPPFPPSQSFDILWIFLILMKNSRKMRSAILMMKNKQSVWQEEVKMMTWFMERKTLVTQNKQNITD